MGSLWDAQRHEDKHSTGIPDISYSTTVHGWVELKYLESPPKKGGVMKIDHFTASQRNWLTRHGKRAGHCFILVQVGSKYLLFSWEACPHIGRVTYEEHLALAVKVWDDGIDWGQLAELLS